MLLDSGRGLSIINFINDILTLSKTGFFFESFPFFLIASHLPGSCFHLSKYIADFSADKRIFTRLSFFILSAVN